MTDKDKKINEIKEFIKSNPNLSGNDILDKLKSKGLGIRRSDFYKIRREVKNLPEPTKAKREASIPIKHRKPTKISKPSAKPTIQKKLPIPFEKTKFGKMTKSLQKKHGISEKNAIRRLRKLLKIPKVDYFGLNQLDFDILTQYGY